MSSSALARVVFGLLVIATAGAFFVTQRLKRSEPVVKRIAVPLFVSPNGDGRKDTARFSFDLPKGDRVTVSIVDGRGDEVRRIADDKRLGRGVHFFTWDGRNAAGRVPPDGFYYVRVILRAQAREASGPRGMHLLTKPPAPRLVAVTPAQVRARRGPPVTIRFSGPASPPPLFSVYRVTAGGASRLVDRFTGPRNQHAVQWAETDQRGRTVPPGRYVFAVTVQNKALVSGTSPRSGAVTVAPPPPRHRHHRRHRR